MKLMERKIYLRQKFLDKTKKISLILLIILIEDRGSQVCKQTRHEDLHEKKQFD